MNYCKFSQKLRHSFLILTFLCSINFVDALKGVGADAELNFVDALKGVGADAELILYEGKSHTDLFLQDPLRGGKDDLFDHLVAVIHAGDEEALAKDALAPPRKRLVPEILLSLARQISPF
ncbi:Prenylcysteine methylesterase, putative [Theobroma cacao]|uniref:Prenylcysteine methylesterase, putative n=1 Tax=Theobroma cacao TaxID=3641 RepID=S1RWK6_THECC|nr:Prenylcysteine methylesterase, putative [Theobroma cacao]